MTEVTAAPPSLSDIDLHKVDLGRMLKAFWEERPHLAKDYAEFIKSTSPLLKKSMLTAYMAGCDDTMKYIARNIKKDGF